MTAGTSVTLQQQLHTAVIELAVTLLEPWRLEKSGRIGEDDFSCCQACWL